MHKQKPVRNLHKTQNAFSVYEKKNSAFSCNVFLTTTVENLILDKIEWNYEVWKENIFWYFYSPDEIFVAWLAEVLVFQIFRLFAGYFTNFQQKYFHRYFRLFIVETKVQLEFFTECRFLFQVMHTVEFTWTSFLKYISTRYLNSNMQNIGFN